MLGAHAQDTTSFVFHQLPVVNTAQFTAQYHVVVRVSLSSIGDVVSSEVSCFLISYERLQPWWPEHDDGFSGSDDVSRTDQSHSQ